MNLAHLSKEEKIKFLRDEIITLDEIVVRVNDVVKDLLKSRKYKKPVLSKSYITPKELVLSSEEYDKALDFCFSAIDDKNLVEQTLLEYIQIINDEK